MTAAEKLKALNDVLKPFAGEWEPIPGAVAAQRPTAKTATVFAKALSRYVDALPQIVAVTLWAEQTIQNFDEYGEVSFIPLIDALEELDKALS